MALVSHAVAIVAWKHILIVEYQHIYIYMLSLQQPVHLFSLLFFFLLFFLSIYSDRTVESVFFPRLHPSILNEFIKFDVNMNKVTIVYLPINQVECQRLNHTKDAHT